MAAPLPSQEDMYSSPLRKPSKNLDAPPDFDIDFATPDKRRARCSSFEDECSTAAPSPWTDRDSMSRFNSPVCPKDLKEQEQRPRFRTSLSTIDSCSNFTDLLEQLQTDRELRQQLHSDQGQAGGAFTACSSLSIFEEGSQFGFDDRLPTPPPDFDFVERKPTPPPPVIPFFHVSPPATPRGAESPVACTAPLPLPDVSPAPATPRRTPVVGDRSPPDVPKGIAKSPLTVALRARRGAARLAAVRAALQEDPEAARCPLWDHEAEPPLCFAVRCGAGADVLEFLLAHGAEVNAIDNTGRTPLELLRASSDQMRGANMPFALAGWSTSAPLPGAGLNFFADASAGSSRVDYKACEQVLIDAGAVAGSSASESDRCFSGWLDCSPPPLQPHLVLSMFAPVAPVLACA
eukprot:TRINITY_DN22718_c0_g1_i1.p1 TRINITY_DN22718_c0_g1~~TRINITY_DN22718_c0_g1_i1.p1  ORF type:complete len:405 (+),score=87.38 TRINITY_DN22718_c0_g1_i1:194-1408(+)